MILLNELLLSSGNFPDMFIRFSFNLIVIGILVWLLYYRSTQRKDYLFTYLMISFVVFFICFLLESINLGLGFALGLFAIFGIIRYRTRQIPIREMTYLFLVIGVSVINALSDWRVHMWEVLFSNLVLLILTFLLERVFFLRHESRKVITYDRIELIKPGQREELKRDLEQRTGLVINRVEVGRVDFLRDTARVYLYYYESDNIMNAADDETDERDDGED